MTNYSMVTTLTSQLQNKRKNIQFTIGNVEQQNKAVNEISDFWAKDILIFIEKPRRIYMHLSDEGIKNAEAKTGKNLKQNKIEIPQIQALLNSIEILFRDFERSLNCQFCNDIFLRLEQKVSQKVSEIESMIGNKTPKIKSNELLYLKAWLKRNSDYYQKRLISGLYQKESLKNVPDAVISKPHFDFILKDESDNDFLTGTAKVNFFPIQNDDGFFKITKGNETREFSINEYYRIYLENWTNEIDKQSVKSEKLKVVNNAIFDFQKDRQYNEHPEIQRLIDRNIEYLNNVKTYLENNSPDELKPRQQNQESFEVDKLLKHQNVLIPNITINEVYSHFKQLTETTNKFNEFYLTNPQLLKFINSTFIENKPIKQKFNSKAFNKKDIRKVFYHFYQYSKNKETNCTALKRKYFNILNNAFDGFSENDYNDFHKI